MLYNIKSLYLQRVFHGIRFKVNNLRLAVRDGWLFSFIGGAFRGQSPCRDRNGHRRDVCLTSASLDFCECLLQILQNVVDVLRTDGETDG